MGAGQPSTFKPAYEYRLFLRNNETWEEEFEFSLEDISFEENVGRVSRLSINGHDALVDKTVIWDEAKSGFYCQFLFELWIFNTTTSGFQFHDRSVWFWFNITRPF
jgi:hypothetical protein